ncbi:hypothetical protein [Rugamonas sp.]|uniref:hypothetical protein n=1 Tax=Rugamonas sp. TaxID=1926287 RepID=UPI0025CE5BF4|nr:hypothetical protein [Rugamonas sp.]
MKILILILLMSSSSYSSASDVDILKEACVSLKTPAKRIECLDAIGRVNFTTKKDAIHPLPAPAEKAFPELAHEDWAKLVSVKNDSFSKDIQFSGISKNEGKTFGSPEYSWKANAFLGKTSGLDTYMISFNDLYVAAKWKMWTWASSDRAEDLKILQGHRDVSSCGAGTCLFSEPLGIMVDRKFMIDAANQGIWIKLKSQTGEEFSLKVSSEDASALLSAVAECKLNLC